MAIGVGNQESGHTAETITNTVIGQLKNMPSKKRRDRLRERLLKLMGGRCSACGERQIAVLQFHHKNKKLKSFPLDRGNLHRPIKDLVKEARKCTILCANCHILVEQELILDVFD